MNLKISGCRLSYVIFSLFISALIVYILHNGFKKYDIILVPIFAVIVYLLIDYSAKRLYEKNLESFTLELFAEGKPVDAKPVEGKPVDAKPVDGSSSDSLANKDVIPTLAAVQTTTTPFPTTLTTTTTTPLPIPTNKSLEGAALAGAAAPKTFDFVNSKIAKNMAMKKDSDFIMDEVASEEQITLNSSVFSTPEMRSRQELRPLTEEQDIMADTESHYDAEVANKIQGGTRPSLMGAPVGKNDKRHREFITSEMDFQQMINENVDAEKPVSINISYNNNRPLTINELN